MNSRGGQIRDYLTNVFQILRGSDDPQIPALVESMAGAATSPEQQAKSWLLQKATPKPIWNFLEAVCVMMKKERNIDATVDVTTKPLPDGIVEVQAKIGPNVFLWDVDLAKSSFQAKDRLTSDFTELIKRA
jgi:hypothetical protein